MATTKFNGTINATGGYQINGTAITSTAAELNILDGVTSSAAELNILDGVTATAAEINSAADTAVVGLTATASITQALHKGKTNYITGSTAAAYTLPEATGSGDVYEFWIGEVNTNGTTFVAADTSNTSFRGVQWMLDADSTAATAYASSSGDDTLTWNGTTKGGAIGDTVRFVDVATDVWFVQAHAVVPAGSNIADPWSSAA